MSTEFSGPEHSGYEDGVTADRRVLMESMRAFSVETNLFLAAVAERLGMSATDFTGLTLLLTRGPLSAGALAEQTGLTTGAITGLVDRLEQGGWVRRAPDPADRRRVIVQPIMDKVPTMRPFLDPMLRDTARIEERFDEGQLAAIATFVEESTAVLAQHVQELRHPEPAPEVDAGGARVARRGRAEAELVLRASASDVTLTTADLGDLLCVADFGDRRVHLTEKDGRIEIGKGGWTRGLAAAGQVVIHRAVRWNLTIKGGASHIVVDLRRARLAALAVSGGANTVEIDLPWPEGLVPIRLHGGVSHVSVTRPAGVGIVPSFRGGTTSLRIDGKSVPGDGRAVMGGTPSPAYSLDVKGGASAIEVVTAPAP